MKINQLLTNVNFNDSNRTSIKYIVIHYVGATGGARDNCKYFEWNYRGASAHYFVGHQGEIWQCVLDEDISWHCGTSGAYNHPYCRNSNAIGIEMCCRVTSGGTWYFEKATVDATVELVKYLMDKYNIPVSNVVRHYDVTLKSCPRPYVVDTKAWNAFKARLTDGTASTVEQDKVTGNTKYKVGEYVSTTILATNSNGGKTYNGKWSGTITRVIEGKAYPYLLNNGTGWTNDVGIDGKQEVKPVEPKPVETPITVKPSTENKTPVQLACEVWQGKHGNGDARKKSLGTNYSTVQKLVEQGVGKSKTSLVTNKALASEVWKGLWGNGEARKDRLTKAGFDYYAVQRLV